MRAISPSNGSFAGGVATAINRLIPASLVHADALFGAAVVESQGWNARGGVCGPLITTAATTLTGAAFMDERTSFVRSQAMDGRGDLPQSRAGSAKRAINCAAIMDDRTHTSIRVLENLHHLVDPGHGAHLGHDRVGFLVADQSHQIDIAVRGADLDPAGIE